MKNELIKLQDSIDLMNQKRGMLKIKVAVLNWTETQNLTLEQTVTLFKAMNEAFDAHK
jgi:hypothetical protein